MVKQLLSDPRLFQVVLLMLCLASAIRWAVEKRWPQVCYWLGALLINGSVLWMK